MFCFRKKPAEIQATLWPGGAGNASHVIDWIISEGGTARYHEYVDAREDEDTGWPEDHEHISINTLEGTMRATPGDWIIRGVMDEFYPCKPDIFAETYEPC